MPRLTATPPKYRNHKKSGQAIVTLNGRDYYLGPHGSKTSRAEYDRVIAEWRVNGRRVPGAADDKPQLVRQLVVTELIAAYWEWLQTYYLKNGKPTSEQANIRIALRHLRKLYSHTPANEFGPLALKALRRYLIDQDDSRKYIGHHIDRVKRLFKWAVEHEIVPPNIDHGLQAVVGLRKGRSAARETEPIKPVAVEYVEASKPFLSRQVWALIRIELLAGMQPAGSMLSSASAARGTNGT